MEPKGQILSHFDRMGSRSFSKALLDLFPEFVALGAVEHDYQDVHELLLAVRETCRRQVIVVGHMHTATMVVRQAVRKRARAEEVFQVAEDTRAWCAAADVIGKRQRQFGSRASLPIVEGAGARESLIQG